MTIESCKNCNYSDEFCVSGDCPNDVDNNNDIQVEVITLNHSKNNRLTIKNAVEVITPMTNYDILKEYEAHKTPIPSYEEYSRLEWYAGCGPDRIVELNKENRQLRKRCEELEELKIDNHNLNAWIKNFQPKYKEMEKENQRLKAIKEKTYNYDYLSECYSKFIKENQQLKELLKECKTPIDLLIKMNINGINGYELLDLLIKIDNAMGEKEFNDEI